MFFSKQKDTQSCIRFVMILAAGVHHLPGSHPYAYIDQHCHAQWAVYIWSHVTTSIHECETCHAHDVISCMLSHDITRFNTACSLYTHYEY